MYGIFKLLLFTNSSSSSSSSSSSHTLSMDFPDSVFPSLYHPYHPLLSVGLPNYILCPYRADENKSLLIDKHWDVHVRGSIEELYSWVRPCFSSCVLFILLGWFLRWEESGRTVVVLEFELKFTYYSKLYNWLKKVLTSA